MKRASLLVLAIACGGNSASSQQATAPTQTAVASAAPAESSAAPQDNSPTPIGTKHKKVGNGWFLSGGGKAFYDAIYEPGADPVIVVKQT